MAVVTSIAAVMKVDSCGSGESLRPRLVGWLVAARQWPVGRSGRVDRSLSADDKYSNMEARSPSARAIVSLIDIW